MGSMQERVKNAWSATGRGLRRVFWHKWLLIAAVVVLVALGGAQRRPTATTAARAT